MTAKIDTFIAEIRSRPEFIAAVAVDPKKSDELEAIANGIEAVYRNPEMIAAFDEIQNVIDRRDLSMKQRLLEIGKILAKARDSGRSVN
jgi:butyrate kinase